jgi:heme exporter protein B
MSLFNTKHIAALIKKDFLLETRHQHTFYAIVLYVISTTFVVYLTMGQPEEQVWNGLFWIVQLFVCINAVAKSFLAESQGRMLYYYSIVNPKDFVVAKLIYNVVLMLLMTALSLLIFIVFLENPFAYLYKFIFISLLGSLGLSLVFTFLAAIAAKAKQQASLMAIMGLPIIIPQLLLLMKISVVAFSSVVQEGFWQMTGLLLVLDLMVIALAVILFPYLWKD